MVALQGKQQFSRGGGQGELPRQRANARNTRQAGPFFEAEKLLEFYALYENLLLYKKLDDNEKIVKFYQ